jgi:hypothetical protein
MARFIHSLILGAFIASVVAAPAAAASPGRAVDITGTPAGLQAAALAAQRLTGVGHPTDAASLTVIREADGSVSTMPKGIARTTAIRPDGTTGPAIVLDAGATSQSPTQAYAGVSPAAAQYWNQINNGCLSEDKSQGWMYSCWSLKKMFNDGYPNNDFYIVVFDGTAHSNGSGMHTAYVELTKNSSSAAFMVTDWTPRSNYYQNCSSQTIGVSYILSWSMSTTECDTWYVYADPIHNPGLQYSEWWAATVYNDAREVTVVQEVETAENASPIWNLYYDFQ